MKTQLTKEQSKHLIELGIDEDKATYSDDVYDWSINDYPSYFTLTDLLEILPKEIDAPYCERFCIMNYMGDYEVGYGFIAPNEGFFFEKSYQESELIDSLYELLVWIITNKYIKL